MSRAPEGLTCVRCGYDLRTLGIAGRCPECGESVWTSVRRARGADRAADAGDTARGLALLSLGLFLLPIVGVAVELLAVPALLLLVGGLVVGLAQPLGQSAAPQRAVLAGSALVAIGTLLAYTAVFGHFQALLLVAVPFVWAGLAVLTVGLVAIVSSVMLQAHPRLRLMTIIAASGAALVIPVLWFTWLLADLDAAFKGSAHPVTLAATVRWLGTTYAWVLAGYAMAAVVKVAGSAR